MSNPDVRWHQRLQSFRKAFGQLSKAVDLAEERNLSDLEQQGLIQAFEFTQFAKFLATFTQLEGREP